jgi:hypothetical protein
MTFDPLSIAHRIRCAVTRIGQVVVCPQCGHMWLEGFEFDQRRDPFPDARICDPQDPEQVAEALQALP